MRILRRRFLWQSESKDYGQTWAAPAYSPIPSIDSAVEMLKLRNGHVVLAFNNGQHRERTPMTLSLSFDGARNWLFYRNLEVGQGSFSYPSIVQTRDDHIHITYSYNRRFIKHIEISETWIMGRDEYSFSINQKPWD